MELDIIDKTGEWFAGAAPLGLRDPTTQVFFVFNRPVKTKKSEWMAGQIAAGTIRPCASPLEPTAIPTTSVPVASKPRSDSPGHTIAPAVTAKAK